MTEALIIVEDHLDSPTGCHCLRWRWRALAIRYCRLAAQMEFEENIAALLAQAAYANARADQEECHGGKIHS